MRFWISHLIGWLLAFGLWIILVRTSGIAFTRYSFHGFNELVLSFLSSIPFGFVFGTPLALCGLIFGTVPYYFLFERRGKLKVPPLLLTVAAGAVGGVLGCVLTEGRDALRFSWLEFAFYGALAATVFRATVKLLRESERII